MKKKERVKFQIGDWVRIPEARTGYWMVVGTTPEYAKAGNGHYPPGEYICDYLFLKKGFTPKLKFRVDGDVCTGGLARKVDEETVQKFHQFFQENPDKLEQFENYKVRIQPSPYAVWLNVPEEEEEHFQQSLSGLPDRFSINELKAKLDKDQVRYEITIPPTDHLLVLGYFYWEVNEKFEQLYLLGDGLRRMEH